MNVLIIPEDQESDRYILKPVVESLFADLSVRARIDVLPEPRLRGADQALDPSLLQEIIDGNPMVDLFLLIIDRDCNRMNHEARVSARMSEHPDRLLACLAWQELEVWMLALHKEKLSVPFSKIRQHCDPKEAFAEPLLEQLGTDGPGGGRKRAMSALKGNWRSLRSLCGELKELQAHITRWRTEHARVVDGYAAH